MENRIEGLVYILSKLQQGKKPEDAPVFLDIVILNLKVVQIYQL